MKTRKSILAAAIFAIALSSFAAVSNPVSGKGDPGLKIGTFDSRAVVFAYSNSALFQEHLKKIQSENHTDMEGQDTVKMIEGAYKMITF